MGAEPQQLHVVIFPFMAHGHRIPMLHIARLFATQENVKVTILTTPLNMPSVTNVYDRGEPPSINIEVFKFPTQEVGLPEGCENGERALELNMFGRFLQATEMLREQLEQYLEKARPNCLVADRFFPWATESAAKFNIPRLIFHATTLFSLCAGEVERLYQPSANVSSDEEEFVLPLLPHEIKMSRLQFPQDYVGNVETKKRAKWVQELEKKSFGVIVNSFYELEPDYADFYRNELARRAWIVGPLCLSNRSKPTTSMQEHEDEHECLKWLNSKKANSVIYLCFGSAKNLGAPQILEIARALEASEQEFIWVLVGYDNDDVSSWLPPGFEHRIKEKGRVIRGWAPQVQILEHEAIGAFVTHCGSSSILEAVCAGVPMVTWPQFADHFFLEKMVTDVLKIGVPVGAKKYATRVVSAEDIIKKDAIAKALGEIMTGMGAEERRCRAKKLKEMAWKAVEECGSSYSDLSSLINELRSYHA